MGQLPTHPELLDWLAAEFRDGGQSLKALHRLIVTSATYRQVVDRRRRRPRRSTPTTRYLWRQNRRKLEAEAVRDAVLAVGRQARPDAWAGRLPGLRGREAGALAALRVRPARPRGPEDRTGGRSTGSWSGRKPQPFMAALDCADPSMQVDKRNETLSPLQALALLNNGFMLAMAGALRRAGRARAGDAAAQVDRRVPAGARPRRRRPTERERPGRLRRRQYGLANACRVILNLNEFVFVD